MDLFNHFPSEQVALIKKDGRRFDNLKALVQSKSVYTQDPSIPIEDGDEFQRVLPSGVVERFVVIDAGFQQGGLGGILPHYQSKVRKTTAPPSNQTSVVYNLVGPNSRVNIQSTDSSTNVVSVDASALFNSLREVIEQSKLDTAVTMRLVESVEAMRASSGTRAFGNSYKEFIAVAADHMGLFAPFLPALSQLLM